MAGPRDDRVTMARLLETLCQDMRYGVRLFLRDPGFSAVALLTLALGIGANTATFSLVNAVLLKPLPFPDPDRLVVLDESRREHGSRTVSWMDYRDWREQNRVFEQMAAYRVADVTFRGDDEASVVRAAEVSSAFFPLLGADPVVGRAFDEWNDRPGGPLAVVVSHDLWTTRLGGRSEVIGRSLALNGTAYTVVGVLPPTFRFFDKRIDIYLPIGLHGADPEWLRRGNHPDMLVIARLRRGVPREAARTAMDVIMRRLEREYPQSNTGLTATITGLYQFKFGSTRDVLLILLASVACVLLIACVNVGNLLLSRSVSREQEMAVRIALGVGRRRLAQQLIIESAMLSVTGGAIGVALALAALPVLLRAAPAPLIPVAAVPVDATVLGFALAVSVASGLLFGSAPAIQFACGNLSASVNRGGRSGGITRGGQTLRSALLTSEIAIALVLLTSAGLLVRSLARATQVNPGFETANLLSLELTIPPTKYVDPERRVLLLTQAVERLKAIPGVGAAGAVQCPPLTGVCVDTAFTMADHAVSSVVDIPTAASNIVAPGYLEAMRTPLLAGRYFSDADTRRTRPVAIVNRTFAARQWPGGSAVGRQVREGGPQGQQPYREIVGVVADMKQNGVDAESRPEVFLPVTQFPFAPWTELAGMTFVVRTDGDPAAVGDRARRALLALDKDLPVTAARALGPWASESLARRRFSTGFLSGFALLALLLAAVGIYGVMAYTVSQSTREIGLRVALGATRHRIRALVLGKVARSAALGILLGWGGSLLATRWLASQLFGVGAMDPLTFLGVAAALLLVTVLACIAPVQRALAVEPLTALRTS